MSIRIGDRVRERDGRHIGVIEWISQSTARIRWSENGFLSDVSIYEVEKATTWVPGVGHVRDWE